MMAFVGEGCKCVASELTTAGDFDDPAVASKGGGIGVFEDVEEVVDGLLWSTTVEQAVFTASAQKVKGKPESSSMVLAVSIKVLFFLSTTPFCSGVLGMLYCLTIPFFTQKASNSLFLNFVPLSLLKLFTGRSNCFSTCVTRSCKMPAVSSFECKKKVHVNLEKSSTITKQYLFFLRFIT
ncbi:hypothetical protein Hanom_Chr07g00602171 [Helianthus anomalus]